MCYSNGDRVKIITESSQHTGELGYITNVYADQESLLVRLDKGKELGYFVDEVELIQSVDDYGQIIKLAEVLHKSGRYDDIPWTEIKADAADLYKAGVRFTEGDK